MKRTINKKDKFTYGVEIELDQKELTTYINEAEQKLASQASFNGFRPGKVPKDVLRKQLGEQQIREEALQIAVQRSIDRVVEEESLTVIDQAEFTISENTDARFAYSITLTVVPEIVLGAYRGLEVKANPIVVADTEIDRVLADVVKSRIVVHDETRAAQIGDRVEVDFTLKDNGTIIEGGKSENHPLIIGDKAFVPGFEDQLVGMNSGDHKKFDLAIPQDYGQKAIAGKNLEVEVTLKKVQSREIPELNDQFIKQLGNFTSVSELKESVRQGLHMEKEGKEKERVRLLLLKQVSDTSTIEIPPSLVEQQLDSMVQNFDHELHEQGMELGLYLSHINKTQDELRAGWKDQAQQQVRYDLIIESIARKEAIVVTAEELDEAFQLRLQSFMRSNGNDQDILKSIDVPAVKRRLLTALLREKVFAILEGAPETPIAA